MIRVAGLWELNWNSPLQESWLWTFVLREFGVMDWRMSPVTGIIHNEIHAGMTLEEHHTPQDLLDSYPDDVIRVFVDEHGDEDLDAFAHPENCVYVFGNAGTAPISFGEARRPQDKSVRIRTPNPSGVLWPHQCLLVVLYDRMMKG